MQKKHGTVLLGSYLHALVLSNQEELRPDFLIERSLFAFTFTKCKQLGSNYLSVMFFLQNSETVHIRALGLGLPGPMGAWGSHPLDMDRCIWCPRADPCPRGRKRKPWRGHSMAKTLHFSVFGVFWPRWRLQVGDLGMGEW